MRTALFARGGSCELLPRTIASSISRRTVLTSALICWTCAALLAAGSWLAERRSPMMPAKKGGKWDGLPASEG